MYQNKNSNNHVGLADIVNKKTNNSAGIFFTAEDGGLDWLRRIIEETVSLFINNFKEFMKRGGQDYYDYIIMV
jgi:hypothetical protein